MWSPDFLAALLALGLPALALLIIWVCPTKEQQ